MKDQGSAPRVTQPRDAMTDDVANALPAYEVGGELGRGAYGRVLQGRHRQLGRVVAIKQLDAGLARRRGATAPRSSARRR